MGKMNMSKSMTKKNLKKFAEYLFEIQSRIDFKMSSRGWCYALEQEGLITKGQFGKVENAVNRCRKLGYIPIDFVAEEDARKFKGIEVPTGHTVASLFKSNLEDLMCLEDYYTPNWWSKEKYYIQCIVEKVDLLTLFRPVCAEYHIPIATSKGWSSMLQRAEYARRFKEAEDNGMTCYLIYCGDHDPDGLRISDTLMSNLEDLAGVRWEDGEDGYNPKRLNIIRFGLNFDFIQDNRLSWIDNLITGSGKNLGSPSHPNYDMSYVRNYLEEIGERKCEANALVVNPDAGRALLRITIEDILGARAKARFAKRRKEFAARFEAFRNDSGLGTTVTDILGSIDS